MPSRILRLWNPDASAWEEVGDSRLTAHLAAGDPHPQYLTATEGGGAFVELAGDTMTGLLTLHGASALTTVLQAKLPADTQPRLRVSAAGTLAWGGGGVTEPEVVLTRAAANQLELSGGLTIASTGSRLILNTAGAYVRLDQSTNAAQSGSLRLANGTPGRIAWRNAASTADLTLTANASNQLATDAPLSVLAPSGNALEVKTGTAPGTTRLAVDQNGTVALTPAAGQAGLTVAAGSVLTVDAGVASGSRVRSNGYLSLDSAANYVFPDRDNGVTLGSAGQRWVAVYAVAGSINTSLAEAKEAITPLAPEDALAAVRATDPVVFDYRPPERPPEWYELPDDPEQAAQVLEQRLTASPLEEGARHQAGFVLRDETGTYATDPLFETGEGQSNAANSAGILLAAVKALDTRLTALEGA